MTLYKFVALTNAVEGKEDAFNQWYNERHVPDMLNVPGFSAPERFELIGAGPHHYLATYDLETDDLEATMKEIGQRAGTPAMTISDAMVVDPDKAQIGVWRKL